MTHPIIQQPDPALDLVFERVVDIPKESCGRRGRRLNTSRNGSLLHRGRR